MEIRPFRGWRYDTGVEADISRLLAPPYDVLSPEDKESLLAGDSRNMVSVDLPHVPPKDVGPDAAYRAAAEKLEEWKASGVMRQDDEPSLYACEQTFPWAGKTLTRRAIICGVRAGELGRDVIPHEHTYDGPKADRLKLTEATRMQISPIFGLYDDPDETVVEAVFSAVPARPLLHGRLREVTEKLWMITDAEAISAVTNELRQVPVFIADGHHRYGTAMKYANSLRWSGQIDDDHEANFVMFSLVALNDPGLLIRPTHRIVSGMKKNFSVHELMRAAGEFTWQRCSVDDVNLDNTDAFLRRYGPGAMAFMDANPAEIWIARLRDPAVMAAAAPDESEYWRRLDVAVLHKLIIDKAIGPWRREDLWIDYTPVSRAVLAACNSGRAQLGVLLQATPLADVQAIASAGGAMPHKSTYFYPKLATGMVLKPLE
ncbi:MAG: DUF1015 domain-containing protein [Planctomycetota bacterium]|nr:DUF1015 domain-containing protein [Planctomycetota bacterium]